MGSLQPPPTFSQDADDWGPANPLPPARLDKLGRKLRRVFPVKEPSCFPEEIARLVTKLQAGCMWREPVHSGPR